jgi:hypothetical protein
LTEIEVRYELARQTQNLIEVAIVAHVHHVDEARPPTNVVLLRLCYVGQNRSRRVNKNWYYGFPMCPKIMRAPTLVLQAKVLLLAEESQ